MTEKELAVSMLSAVPERVCSDCGRGSGTLHKVIVAEVSSNGWRPVNVILKCRSCVEVAGGFSIDIS